jgi:polysaccharide export outer membrane protein
MVVTRRISRMLIIAILPLTLAWACTSVSMQASVASLETASDGQLSDDYEIGPADILEVIVWKNDALSKLVTVRPDGKISLPLIGDVQASGHTAQQVKDLVAGKLSDYYREMPSVSVIVQQSNSYVIYIMGEVLRPAQYQVKQGTTFLQAIALAGGFTPFAAKNNILVLRQTHPQHKQMAIPIRYKEILSGHKIEDNILLKPGDVIVVQ